MHKIVDSNSKGINACESHYERCIGKVKTAKFFREIFLQYLKNHAKSTKVADAIVTGNFNEDVHSKNIQGFSLEAELHNVFDEAHIIEKGKRDSVHDHVKKMCGCVFSHKGHVKLHCRNWVNLI